MSIAMRQGSRVRMAGTIVDVTERKHAEEALRLAEEKYRNIFKNSAHGIFQSTPQGRFLSVNPAMVRIYGYEDTEGFLNCVLDIRGQLYVDPADWAGFVQGLEMNSAISGFVARNRRKEGSISPGAFARMLPGLARLYLSEIVRSPRFLAIMLGGAPVTKDVANRFGADGYAESAGNAVSEGIKMIARLRQMQGKA